MLPTLFETSLWFTPKSQREESAPAEFLVRTFPYHFLSTFQLAETISSIDGVHSNTIERAIFEYCVIDYNNIYNSDGTTIEISQLIKVLPSAIVNELLEFIFSIAMYTEEFTQALTNSLYTLYNPRFHGESWNCTVCQARRLDRQRNCPFLPKEDHDPQVNYPTYSGIVLECPIGSIDTLITNKAIEAYKYREQSLLPEDGGIRNQTLFFMLASQKVEEISNYYERKRQENSKSK